jgi:predicted Co/Zn/Cd cation transporter (cation efflux family)
VLIRLPLSMQDMTRKSTVLLVVVNTDSARSCIRAAKHFRSLASIRRLTVQPHQFVYDGMLALHTRCLMHQLALIVARLLKDGACNCSLPAMFSEHSNSESANYH